MDTYLSNVLAALWLGILTSISPCPLATNIAAVSYIGKRLVSLPSVIVSGILYTLGRMIAYAVVGAVVIAGLLSIPSVSLFLQRYMNMLLGPFLILTGMMLLEMISLPFSGSGAGARIGKRIERFGIAGSFILGCVFALAFCPVSAALFFGSLIPLAVDRGSSVMMPFVYGIGTALPVFVFALLAAFGVRSLSRVFEKVTIFEKWARTVTGIVFIGTGVYLTLSNVFHVI